MRDGTLTGAGYLVVAGSATDGRRQLVLLTPAGQSMLAEARRWQEEVFDRLTEGWCERRRREFPRAMGDLIERSHALDV